MANSFSPLELSKKQLYFWTIKILREHGIRPRKKLSQNFVVDPELLREVAGYVEKEPTVEIGCGIGTLSLALIHKTPRLVCVEIDEKLCEISRDVVKSVKFIVVRGDAREHSLLAKQVVSNLPYHITSDLIVKIARENNIERAVLTVQKEVAERLASKPGTRSYGKLSVLVNVLFAVKLGGVYPPSSFYPAPEVHHQVVVLERKRPYGKDVEFLEVIVKKLFTQRRRVLDKLLEEFFGVKLSELGELGRAISGKRVYFLEPHQLYELAMLIREKGVSA
ncbi:MAG: 16S rRNA (adenine(1518)-N(6)/adenine(1519)-N(6))-dimethyltransferase RsmA [Desulfurococcaceae archaeon]